MWQPIETAPKNRAILLYGIMEPGESGLEYKVPHVFSGYWDPLDEAWCSHGSTWLGPFYTTTHWQELPGGPT
jgi:hypothetical protein